MKYLLTIFLFLLLMPFIIASEVDERPIVIVMGTRPEAIKLLPLYHALQEEKIPTLLCSTGQHRELVEDVLAVFKANLDKDLAIMKQGQDLFHITESVLSRLKEWFQEVSPRLVVVQGDTTSAFTAALAAFYLKIPVAHVEAGLRSGNMQAPFPEEMNRRSISVLSSLHFAPTVTSSQNLLNEGVDPSLIYVTGNTVVDALHSIQKKIALHEVIPSKKLQELVLRNKNLGKKIVLLTAHRRESFEGGLHHIFDAIKKVLLKRRDLFVIFPAHPNPLVKKAYTETELDQLENMYITKPLSYFDLVFLLTEADGVATDSGGIQEEAVSLQKPTLILRNETDRPEGVDVGIAKLVGTDKEMIYQELLKVEKFEKVEESCSPYGDGKAAIKIAHYIKEWLECPQGVSQCIK